jgi:DNA-binding GntR family transcriptional regulator
VRELVERLVAHEAETRGQEETLRQCEQDVQRMIRLARQGDVAADVA